MRRQGKGCRVRFCLGLFETNGSTVCFKKTEATQLARQGGRLNSTVCFKETEAIQLAQQGFCTPIQRDDLFLVFYCNSILLLWLNYMSQTRLIAENMMEELECEL